MYEQARYLGVLHSFGLRPPVSLLDIAASYRLLVKRYHPDRFLTPAERGVATRKLQEINAARDYLVAHCDAFMRAQQVESPLAGKQAPASANPQAAAPSRVEAWDILPKSFWAEILLSPVLALHGLALLACALPLFMFQDYERPDSELTLKLKGIYLTIGPHLLTLALFIGALAKGEPVGVMWTGATVIVMLAVEIIAQIIGVVTSWRLRGEVKRAESALVVENR